MKNFVTVAAAATLMAPGAAMAEEADFLVATGADLAALCSAAPADADYAAAIHMCQGFIVGVDQFHTAVMQDEAGAGIYCLPPAGAPSRDEAAASFAAWVAETPRAGDLRAVEALVRWAAAVYPCK
ncbi:MAG: Rap1a/Tai family immunity protein [Pikeienuella sp.]